MQDGRQILDLNFRLLSFVKVGLAVGGFGFEDNKGVLPCFALDVVHVLCELVIALVGQCAALNHNHQGRMPAVDEVVIIEPFGAAAAIDAQNLPYPAHFSVGLDADGKVQDLVCFIGDIERFSIFEVMTVAPVHAARVAKLLEIDDLAAELLLEFAKLLFPLDGLTVGVVDGINAGFQRDGHADGRRIMQKFDLLDLSVKTADDFQIGDAVCFAGFNEVFKDFLCVLLCVQQLNDAGHAVVLRVGFIAFLDVLGVLDADAKACNVVFVGADALRQDGRFADKIMQTGQLIGRFNPVASVKSFLLRDLRCGVGLLDGLQWRLVFAAFDDAGLHGARFLIRCQWGLLLSSCSLWRVSF